MKFKITGNSSSFVEVYSGYAPRTRRLSLITACPTTPSLVVQEQDSRQLALCSEEDNFTKENMQHPVEGMPMQPPGYERAKDPREAAMTNYRPASIPRTRDHIVWSLFNTLYMNACCLGFVALYFSVKARDRKVVGDVEGARKYGSSARCLNIAALTLTLLFFIIVIALIATGTIVVAKAGRHHVFG